MDYRPAEDEVGSDVGSDAEAPVGVSVGWNAGVLVGAVVGAAVDDVGPFVGVPRARLRPVRAQECES